MSNEPTMRRSDRGHTHPIMRSDFAVLPSSLRPLCSDDNIRIGRAHDGGYIVPHGVLQQCRLLLSFGVNLDWSFEMDAVQRFPELRVKTFDYTTSFSFALWWGCSRFLYSPISRKKKHALGPWKPVDYLRFKYHPRISHTRKFVGPASSSNFVDVRQIFAGLASRRQVFLKMDIEGGEYAILDTILAHESLLAGMAIEFHGLLANAQYLAQLERLQEKYFITHVHANNIAPLDSSGFPTVIEITFIHKSLIKTPTYFAGLHYRLPIDAPNYPENVDLAIRFS